jgi:hypothetical protein
MERLLELVPRVVEPGELLGYDLVLPNLGNGARRLDGGYESAWL